MYSGQRVLITGGFGFIGSHLTKFLIEKGANVNIICLASTDKSLLANYLEKIKIFEIDIQDTSKIEEAVLQIQPDYVFHLASYGVNSANQNPLLAANINIIGSINLIKAISKIHCKKFINIGTSSEYGDNLATENNILNPVDIYGSTKAAATLILHQLARENDIDIITLRLFGVFGEGESPHKIFSYVILNILKGQNVKLTKCEQIRDYIYVENVVDAIIKAGLSPLKNEVINIASGNYYPLKHYIDLIFDNMNTDKKPLYGLVEYRTSERFAPVADIKKAQDLLNFSISVPFEEGLKQTILWYQNREKGNLWSV